MQTAQDQSNDNDYHSQVMFLDVPFVSTSISQSLLYRMSVPKHLTHWIAILTDNTSGFTKPKTSKKQQQTWFLPQ